MLNKLKRKFSDPEVEEIIDQHAQELLLGRDITSEIAGQHAQDFPAIEPLLGITKRLYTTLIPVEPSPDFVDELRDQLRTNDEKRLRSASRWSNLRLKSKGSNQVVGMVISGLAIGAVVFRIIGSAVMLMTFLGRRKKAANPASV